jgi:hypothetical protein
VQEWLLKGLIVLETPWRTAGFYPAGATVLEEPGKYLVPDRIKFNDILILDSSNIDNGKTTVNLPMQMVAYTTDKAFREWYISQCEAYARNLILGSVQSWSRTYNIFVDMGRADLLAESGRFYPFTHSLLHRVASRSLVGDVWRHDEETEELEQNNGSSIRGLVRGLPVTGKNLFVVSSESVPVNEIYMTRGAADYIDAKEGDIIHSWRCPILPHPGVAARLTVSHVYGEKDCWNNSQQDCEMDWRDPDQFNVGNIVWLNPETLACMDGDEDGDKIMITRDIHNKLEVPSGHEFDPPQINPNEEPDCKVEKLFDDHVWCSRSDRIELGGASVTRISDWVARRAMDLLNGWYDCNAVGNKFYHIDAEEGVSAEHNWRIYMGLTRMVRAMIQAKKHPVNQSDQRTLALSKKDGLPIDTYRRVEALLCSRGGLYVMKKGEDGILRRQIVTFTDNDGNERPVTDLIEELEVKGYPYARILRAIVNAYDEVWKVYLNDPYHEYHISDQTNLSKSRIAWNSDTNKGLRSSRLSRYAQTYLPKDGVHDQPGIPMDGLSEITGSKVKAKGDKLCYYNQVTGEPLEDIPVLAAVARSVMKERRCTVKVGDKTLERFVRRDHGS